MLQSWKIKNKYNLSNSVSEEILHRSLIRAGGIERRISGTKKVTSASVSPRLSFFSRTSSAAKRLKTQSQHSTLTRTSGNKDFFYKRFRFRRNFETSGGRKFVSRPLRLCPRASGGRSSGGCNSFGLSCSFKNFKHQRDFLKSRLTTCFRNKVTVFLQKFFFGGKQEFYHFFVGVHRFFGFFLPGLDLVRRSNPHLSSGQERKKNSG